MSLSLSSLYEHPLKSARGNLVPSAEVQPEGLALDRRFLAHTPDGTFISGRSHPGLVRVGALWDGTTLRLTFPGRTDLALVPTAAVEASVAVWKDRFTAWDQGEGAARWLSEALGDSVRLAWLGESQRTLRWDRDRRVTFADAAPLLLIGTASLADLEARVGEGLGMRRFRPNLVVDGAGAYEEDSWRRLRIGGVEFLNLDGCGRCEFTTVDPETGLRHPRNEPVATLEGYRATDTGIYFGMNLMPLTSGILRVGDPVTVLDRRRPLVFGGFTAPARPGESEAPGPLVCTAVRDEAPGVRTFTLARKDGRELRWEAGQHLTLRFDQPEGPLRRTYTLSSAPGTAAEVTIKGRTDRLAVGAEVFAEALGGSFTLGAQPWSSYLFLGAGSGMTPLISMLRDIARRDRDVAVAVHQCARTRADLLFTDELEGLKAVLGDRLTVENRVTGEAGRLDHQSLVRFCPDLRDRVAFVCGPAGYRSTVRGLLAGAGFKVDRRCQEELFGDEVPEAPAEVLPGILTFARSGKEAASDGRTTVLQLAEGSGVPLASSCRTGDCGTCRVRTSTGEWLLACRTVPRGDLSLDL